MQRHTSAHAEKYCFSLASTLHQKIRPPLLILFHLSRLVAGRNEQATMENFHTGIGNFVVGVETATLAHRSDGVGEGVMDIVVEHFVPPVRPSEDIAHDPVQPNMGSSPFRLRRLTNTADASEKILPWV